MKINTDAEFYNSEEDYIRSSTLKPFHGCSYLYYAQNILKLPQDSNNDGARMGSVCHTIFELLLNPRHRRYYDRIMESGSIKGNHRENLTVLELIWKLMKREGLPEKDSVYQKINDMLMVGFNNDFFVKGGEIISAEYRFKHRNESPKYYIIGTMDKIALKNEYVIIYDYKSSKQKYKGDDKNCNYQALMYSLFASKKWPDKKPIIRFIFLQFPDNPILEIQFDVHTLRGFEYMLESDGFKMKDFTEENALSNLAAYQEIPRDGSFGGKLLCGFSKFPGQLKKDGTLMFGCIAKWPFSYFKVKNKNNNWIISVKRQEEYILKEGEYFEEVNFEGCPAHKNKFI